MCKDKNKNGQNYWLSNILAGICGSIVAIILLVIFYFCFLSNFKTSKAYFVRNSQIDAILEKQVWTKQDIITLKQYLSNNYVQQAKTLEALKSEKVIITPEQYSSDLSNYYNTLVAVLAALLVILNIIAYLSLKTNAESEYRAKIQDLEEQMDDKLSKTTENLLLDSEKVHTRIQALLVEWSSKASSESDDEEEDASDLKERLSKIESNIANLIDLLAGKEAKQDSEKTGAKIKLE